MNKKLIIAGVGTFASGLGLGWVASYYVNRGKFQAQADAEIQSIKDAYAPYSKEGIYATPEGAALTLGFSPLEAEEIDEITALGRAKVNEILEENGYSPLNTPGEPDPITGETIVSSIIENSFKEVAEEALPMGSDEEDEEEATLPDRDPDHPYIISKLMFDHDETYDGNKSSLTYYEEDETLTDERETILNNIEEVVGIGNLNNFGLGSGDHNVLYVRNEKLQTDIEIVRDPRSFQEVVLGVKPGTDRGAGTPRRMRDNDE